MFRYWDILIGCKTLSISFPSRIIKFGYDTFKGCKILSIIVDITTIPSKLFYDCNSITQLFIPFSVTLIEDGAFFRCSSLTHISIPLSVTSIGEGAFFGCKSLKQIVIPF